MGVHLERGRVLYQQNRYDDAAAELVRELAENPESSEAHSLYALVLAQLGRSAEAIEAAERAVGADPDSGYAHFVLGKVHYEADDNEEAERAMREALRIAPDEPAYYAILAAIQFDNKEPRDALKTAEEGLAIDPENVSCLNLRSMALTQLGRRDEAHEGLEAALAADPDSSMSHANKGWTYLHAGDARAALEHFSEALRLDPESDWARGGLVEALKARNPIYRAILTWYLFSNRLSSQARWALVLGLMFGARVLKRVLRQYESLTPLAAVVAIAYMSIIYLSWVAIPLFNLMLLLDKLGRHALSKEQRTSALCFGGSLLLALALAGLNLALGFMPEAAVMGLGGLALGIPVAAVSSMEPGRRRSVGLGFIALAASALVFGAILKPIGLDPESQVPLTIGLSVMAACALSTWAFSLSKG